MDPFTPGYGEFQGIPKKKLPDDTVQYFIYAPDSHCTSNLRAEQYLVAVKEAAEALLVEWGKEYIWQRDRFQLELAEENGLIPSKKLELLVLMKLELGVKYLSGKTEFGDAIDDEWFIVAILRELSRRFESSWIRLLESNILQK